MGGRPPSSRGRTSAPPGTAWLGWRLLRSRSAWVAAAALLANAVIVIGPGARVQASTPAEISPRSGGHTVLGDWTSMGALKGSADDSFQGPGLNQAVYALAEYQDFIYAGGLFDDTGGGGNNEANCSDDADYPLMCIARWQIDGSADGKNPWLPLDNDPNNGLNNQVDAFLVKDGLLYVGGMFDGTVNGSGYGRCNPSAGIAWTPRGTAPAKAWNSVTWGDNRFVAVASAGAGNRAMYSTDGANWTEAAGTVPANDWRSVTWGGGRFVAVAPSSDDSQVMTSSDGITWTRQPAVSDDSWTAVAYGAGRFVAVASSGDDTRAMYSTNGGATWNWSSSGVAASEWSSVSYGSGRFVAVAANGDDTPVMYSTDGDNWYRPVKRVPVKTWESVAWSDVTNTFVAVASDRDDSTVMTSKDGLVWTQRTGSAYKSPWNSVTWAGDMYVAVAPEGDRRVMYSPDGVTWSTRTSGTVLNQWQSVARGGTGDPADDTIAIVGASGADRVMTSVATPSPGALKCIATWDGSNWSPLGDVSGTGLEGGVYAMGALGDGTLLVSGGFNESSPVPSPDYGPDTLTGLVAWSGSGWTHPGVGGWDNAVYSLLTVGDDVAYFGGQFRGDGPSYDAWGITRMNGPYDEAESWRKMSPGFMRPDGDPGLVDALATLGDTVYAGGYFNRTGTGAPFAGNIASWNGSGWSIVGRGLSSDNSSGTSVRELATDQTRGLLYIGGTFDNLHGAGNGKCDDTDVAVGPLRCVTVWDSGIDEYIPFQWGSDDDSNGLTGEVSSFVVKGKDVYVGGQFNTWPEGGFPKAWNMKNVGKWTWRPPTGAVSASASSGETVAITGTRFIGVPSDGVKFGSTVVPFTRTSTERITATVPSSLASGTYTISVNGVGGWADVGTVAVTQRSGGGGGGGTPTPTAAPNPTPPASASAAPTPRPTAAGPTVEQLRATHQVRPDRVRALANGVPPGRSIVIVDGRAVPNRVTVGSQGMTVKTGPITMAVGTQNPRGANQRPVAGSLSIPYAGVTTRAREIAAPRIQLKSSGNAALTPVRVFLIPQPKSGPRGIRALDLGYLMTDAQGRLQGEVVVPARRAGRYIVQINGAGSDGRVRSINLPAIVRAPSGRS